MTKNERPCEHANFQAVCNVNRLSKVEGGPITGYSVDVRVLCDDCKLPFRFIGLPGGSSPAYPTTSIDGAEARMPIGPSDSTSSILDELQAANSGSLN